MKYRPDHLYCLQVPSPKVLLLILVDSTLENTWTKFEQKSKNGILNETVRTKFWSDPSHGLGLQDCKMYPRVTWSGKTFFTISIVRIFSIRAERGDNFFKKHFSTFQVKSHKSAESNSKNKISKILISSF